MKPKVRFKGFEKEWENIVLGTVGTFRSNGVDKKINPDETLINLLNYMDIYNCRQLNKENCNQLMHVTATERQIKECNVIANDIFFTPTSETPDDIGHALVIEETLPNTCYSYHLMRFRPNDGVFYSTFPNQGFQTAYVRNQLRLYASGVQRFVISKPNFESIKVWIPSLPEQQNIATYFKSLDALIQATTKKVAQLKQLKAASLISMFPQEGETKPKVRFKGFEGEWECKQLNECLTISGDINDKNVYGFEDVLSVSDDFGVMNQIELLGRSYAGKSVSNYGILKTGEIVYTKSPLKSKPFGIIKENTGKTGIVSVLYAVYIHKEDVCASYIHYYFTPEWRLNNYLRPLINKGAKNTMNISDETALTGEIMIPRGIEEQQRIASYFQNLDTQIRLQEQRLEKLKQIKTACLEQMFV